MSDLSDLQQSEVTRLVGGNEQFAADVVESNEFKSLSTYIDGGSVSTSVDGSGLIISVSEPNTSMTSSQAITLVNKTGKGFLGGIKAQFSYELGSVRVTIDGVQSFFLSCRQLRDFNFESYTDTGLSRWFAAQQYGEFEFFPSQLIGYNESLLVELVNQAGFTITYNRSMVIYS